MRFRSVTCISVVVTVLAVHGVAVRASVPAAEAHRIFDDFARQSGAPGIAVSVGICDRIAWSEGFGFADLEQQVRADPAVTRFRIGSVAKPMTALALVGLSAQGRIDLDADVRHYVPEFPKKSQTFSVRQLAGHLAGIRHYRGHEAYLRKHYASVSESLQIFKDDPLVSDPGVAWNYSSYGYNLLSAVIENASGQPFLKQMETSVFAPLGMGNTTPDRIEDVIPGRGRYYVRKNGRLQNEPEVDNSYKWASGGFLATTDDLVRFGLAHFDDRHVTTQMRELLWTEQHIASGEPTGYGIGWRVVKDDDGGLWIGHGGGAIGGTTQFWLFPEDRVVIAMATNLTELDYGDVLPQLRALFLRYTRSRERCDAGHDPTSASSNASERLLRQPK